MNLKGQYSVLVNRFDGGLNTKVTPQHGEPDESPDMQNVVFDDAGAIETRAGFAIFNTAPIASASIDGVHSYINSATARLMAACYGSVWACAASGTSFITIPSAQSVYTAGVPVQFDNFYGHAFVSNGYVDGYKWNGTEYTRWGVPTCSAPTAALSAAVGLLNGSYKYTLLGINSANSYGNYGTASTEVAAALVKVNVTEIPTFPISHGVNYVAICRNTANASGIYYVLTQVANGTTTYLDNTADSALVTLAPTDNAAPPKYTVFLHHMERFFGAAKYTTTPMRLWYSDVNSPYIFPSDQYIEIDKGDGLPIVGLARLSNGIIISKADDKGNTAVYFLYTPDAVADNWSITKLNTRNGSEAARVMCSFANFIMMINRHGVFDLNDAAIGDIKSDALSFNIEPDIYALADAYVKNCAAIAWKNKVWLSVPYGAVTANNRIYQYDYVRGRDTKGRKSGAWSKFSGIAVSDFTVHEGALMGGASAANGYVYTLDTGTADNATAIDSYYKTMVISGREEHISHTKVWRQVALLVECSGTWNLEMTYINPYKGESGTQVVVDLTPGGSLWGTFTWGTDKWGTSLLRKKVLITLRNTISTAVQFKFRAATADQYFKIHEMEIFYNLLGVRG